MLLFQFPFLLGQQGSDRNRGSFSHDWPTEQPPADVKKGQNWGPIDKNGKEKYERAKKLIPLLPGTLPCLTPQEIYGRPRWLKARLTSLYVGIAADWSVLSRRSRLGRGEQIGGHCGRSRRNENGKKDGDWGFFFADILMEVWKMDC